MDELNKLNNAENDRQNIIEQEYNHGEDIYDKNSYENEKNYYNPGTEYSEESYDDMKIGDNRTGKTKKKSGFFVKACAFSVSAILLGGLAGGAFYGTNRLLEDRMGVSSSVKDDDDDKDDKQDNEKEDLSNLENQLTMAPTSESGSQGTSSSSGNLSVEQIAATELPSVVAITNLGVSEVQTMWGTYQQDSKSAGSGVIISRNDKELIILTNYHVVSDTKELTVVFSFDESKKDAKAVKANVKGYDAERDIAVISIPVKSVDEETLKSIKVAVVGKASDLKLGEQVVAIGNALGYGQSVTTGIVSALNRHVELKGTNNVTISNDYIQTDAAINPGNSGGALYNMRGELVGINSAKVASSQVEGMGYAIPMDDIKELVTKLMNMEAQVSLSEEEQGYLGIAGSDVDSGSVMYGVPAGVYVSAVGKGTAADNAQIRKGDIISQINGKSIKSMTEMKKELSYIKGGTQIKVVIYRFDERKRAYEELSIDVKLDTYETFKKASESMSEE